MTQARGVKGVQNRAVFKFRAQDVPDQVSDSARLQVRRLGRQGNLNTEGGRRVVRLAPLGRVPAPDR
jgi:hypothetical protein